MEWVNKPSSFSITTIELCSENSCVVFFFFQKQIYTKVQSTTMTEINIKKQNMQTNKTNKNPPSHPPSVLFTMYY